MDLCINTNLNFTTIECCSCGTLFAVPAQLYGKLKETHNTFYCPSRHSQYFSGESKGEKYKRKLEEAEKRHSREADRIEKRMSSLKFTYAGYASELTSLKRRLAAQKGMVTRLRNQLARECAKNTPLKVVEKGKEHGQTGTDPKTK